MPHSSEFPGVHTPNSTWDKVDDAGKVNQLLSQMNPMITDFIRNSQAPGAKVCNTTTPLDLSTQLNIDNLPTEGKGVDGTVQLVQQVLDHSVHTWNPGFLDKLYASTDAVGVGSELLLGALNANVHVYSAAPVVTLMEVTVIRALGRLLGYGEKAGGMACPGGSASNTLSLITARNKAFPYIREEGYRPEEHPSIFTSEQSHYSVDKAAAVIGLGSRRVYKVACDEEGRMIPEDLEARILESKARGETPFYVNATAGSTVLAAFDPLEPIADICSKHKLWLHVDGSWGGSAIMSTKHRHLMNGIHRTDSFTINPHKLLGVPLQCSLLVTREADVLRASNALNAAYLFHGSPYDLGDGGIGCGRRGDALKFYLSWHHHGLAGLEARVDRAFSMATYLENAIIRGPQSSSLLLALPRQSVNVCFWVLPPWLKEQPELRNSNPSKWYKSIAYATEAVHGLLHSEGQFMIDYSPLPHGLPQCFRVPCHPTANPELFDAMVDRLVSLASTLSPPSNE